MHVFSLIANISLNIKSGFMLRLFNGDDDDEAMLVVVVVVGFGCSIFDILIISFGSS
jgi:hypothetical protein